MTVGKPQPPYHQPHGILYCETLRPPRRPLLFPLYLAVWTTVAELSLDVRPVVVCPGVAPGHRVPVRGDAGGVRDRRALRILHAQLGLLLQPAVREPAQSFTFFKNIFLPEC